MLQMIIFFVTTLTVLLRTHPFFKELVLISQPCLEREEPSFSIYETGASKFHGFVDVVLQIDKFLIQENCKQLSLYSGEFNECTHRSISGLSRAACFLSYVKYLYKYNNIMKKRSC
jgi:hypothetical protein